MAQKAILYGILGVFICMTVCTASYAGSSAGYINLQRLVSESSMGKEASRNLAKLRQEKEAVATQMLQKINNLKKSISSKDAPLSLEIKRVRLEELQKAVKQYQRMVEDAKEDLLKEDRELVADILKKADQALKKVAKKRKFAIILKDVNVIGYLDPKVDITNDVLKELEKN